MTVKVTPNEFGEHLRLLRTGANKTLADVAAALEISVPYLSDVERGRRHPLSLDQIEKAIAALGLGEDEVNSLVVAKVKQTGQIVLRPKRWQCMLLCVEIHRAIEKGSITPELARSLRDQIRSAGGGQGTSTGPKGLKEAS